MAGEGLDSLWTMIKEVFSGLIDKIIALLPGVATLMKVIDDPLGAAGDAASAVGEGITNVASSGWDWIKDTVSGNAKGGVIVKRPTYLPSTGTVVGEHPTWKGGAARGSAGQSEMVVPFKSGEGQQVLGDFSRSIASAVKNQMGENLNAQMYARIGAAGPAGMGSAPPNIVDASTNTNVTNNTIIRTPSPSGPNLHFEGRDFVHKVA
jgi:hypothetical protein